MVRCKTCKKISFLLDKNGMCKNCVNYYLDSAQRILNEIDELYDIFQNKSKPFQERKTALLTASSKFQKMMQSKEGETTELHYPKIIIQVKEGFKKIESEFQQEAEKIAAHEKAVQAAQATKLDFEDCIMRYLSTPHIYAPKDYDDITYKKREFDCILSGIPLHKIMLSDVGEMVAIDFDYKSKNITVKTNLSKIRNFVAVDTETTGLYAGKDRIVEVSAIKFENFMPVEIFTTLVNPQMDIPYSASKINGITTTMVESQPTFLQIKDDLLSFIGNLPIVAHNAEFDIKFLITGGLALNSKTVIYDTLELSRRTYDWCKNYKLATVCHCRYIEFDGNHRSSADALAAGLLFIEIIKSKMNITDVLNF